MSDLVLEGFLKRQLAAGMELAAQSDLLVLHALNLDRYIAEFRCRGLVLSDTGELQEASWFLVGIWFPSDYCRHADPSKVLTFLEPMNVFHPNIRPPLICARIMPSMELPDLLYTLFEIITYSNFASHDGLNLDACQYARNHQDRFPLDQRPLKRAADLHITSEARTP